MVATAPEIDREAFVARLTNAAYQVALRHGIKGSFATLQLDMWKELQAACFGVVVTEDAEEDLPTWLR